jgi:hypothetical protein
VDSATAMLSWRDLSIAPILSASGRRSFMWVLA